MYSTGTLAINFPQNLADLKLRNQAMSRRENIISDIPLFQYHGDEQSIKGLLYKGGGRVKRPLLIILSPTFQKCRRKKLLNV